MHVQNVSFARLTGYAIAGNEGEDEEEFNWPLREDDGQMEVEEEDIIINNNNEQ